MSVVTALLALFVLFGGLPLVMVFTFGIFGHDVSYGSALVTLLVILIVTAVYNGVINALD